MVFLNGQYLDKNQAFVSVMDRGFLFSDGVYEVIPVYQKNIFRLSGHLNRLQNSLDAINVDNPYSKTQWQAILERLIEANSSDNQSIYIQVTRGVDKIRKHTTGTKLVPTVFVESNDLYPFDFDFLKKGHFCSTKEDIRWHRCDIKSIALLANVLYAQTVEKDIVETILVRDNVVTEGSSSNIFIIKNNNLYTHPANEFILSGITRQVILELATQIGLEVQEQTFSLEDLCSADEVLISSSTREVMPIVKIDNYLINEGKVGIFWEQLYQGFQILKKTS
jgi:D-alanine transaminase